MERKSYSHIVEPSTPLSALKDQRKVSSDELTSKIQIGGMSIIEEKEEERSPDLLEALQVEVPFEMINNEMDELEARLEKTKFFDGE